MNTSITRLLLLVFMAGVCAAATAQTKLPHIVLFITDDLGWAECPIYGGPDARMPNLDRLAAAGMTFTHAFIASPSCAPSRAALLTGLDPMRNGSMLNHARPRAEIKKWPAYFKELGYETAISYRARLGIRWRSVFERNRTRGSVLATEKGGRVLSTELFSSTLCCVSIVAD